MRWVVLPFLAYILLLPVVVIIEIIGGRGSIGDNALDEYLILVQVLFLYNLFTIFKRKSKSDV